MQTWKQIADKRTFALEVPGGVLIRVGTKPTYHKGIEGGDPEEFFALQFLPGLRLEGDTLVSMLTPPKK